MRIREVLLGVGVALVLTLSACGQGQGPPPQRPPADPAELEVLRTKLRALMSDPCHRQPTQQQPQSCEKFITQLGNTASTVAATARAGQPDLAEPAGRMQDGITAYRDARCHTDSSASDQVCGTALSDLAAAVEDAHAVLAAE